MYRPEWQSLEQYRVPPWYMDAKFGIFVHWGPYSVPAFGNEWYPRFMYQDASSPPGVNFLEHHTNRYGHPGEFGYKDFIPEFRAQHWDPQAWVELFKASGARYVIPVAEHHDGFPMYGTSYTPWNSLQMGPRRDVIGELAAAVRQEGLKFGVSSHRAYNWRYYTYDESFDTVDPTNSELYSPAHGVDEPAPREWLEDWHARTRELIDRFEPDVLYFDFGWHFDEFAPYRPQILAYYYNRALAWGKEVVLHYKEKLPAGVAVMDVERGKFDHLRAEYWQTDTAVSYDSWCYIENDRLKPATVLIHDLIDIVSKNGNLLLNVGPRPDGTIPNEAAERLRAMGRWLADNGEAIYGTRPWHKFGEGPTQIKAGPFKEKEDEPFTAADIRFTRKGNVLYAILLGRPGEEVLISSLGKGSSLAADDIQKVTMLAGEDRPLKWSQDESGLTVALPTSPMGEHAFVLKLVLKRAGESGDSAV